MSGLIPAVQIIMLPVRGAIQRSNDIRGGEEDEATTPDTGVAADGGGCAGIGVGLSEPKFFYGADNLYQSVFVDAICHWWE